MPIITVDDYKVSLSAVPISRCLLIACQHHAQYWNANLSAIPIFRYQFSTCQYRVHNWKENVSTIIISDIPH